MKPVAFKYERPTAVAEAMGLLVAADGAAKVIAGGQSLGPMLNLRLSRPDLLVDISHLAELAHHEDRGNTVHVGALTTHAALEDGRTALGGTGFVPSVARGIAYRSVRNRGTVGGSLMHADPAADWPLALAALGATAEVASGSERRRIPVANLAAASFTTTLGECDLLVGVEIVKLSRSAQCGYFKFCRKIGEFAEASAAVVLDPERGLANVFIGALGVPPRPLPALAEALASRGPDQLSASDLETQISEAAPGLDAIDLRLHAATLSRAIKKAFAH